MVPSLAISTFIECVFVRRREARSRLVCSRVLPRGGSIGPTVVGITPNLCWKQKKTSTMLIFWKKQTCPQKLTGVNLKMQVTVLWNVFRLKSQTKYRRKDSLQQHQKTRTSLADGNSFLFSTVITYFILEIIALSVWVSVLLQCKSLVTLNPVHQQESNNLKFKYDPTAWKHL